MTTSLTTTPGAATVSAGRKPTDDELDVFGLTHPGRVRKTNQDHFLIASLRRQMMVHLTSLESLDAVPLLAERLAFLAVVADGVGGSSAGGNSQPARRQRGDAVHRGQHAVLLRLARRGR